MMLNIEVHRPNVTIEVDARIGIFLRVLVTEPSCVWSRRTFGVAEGSKYR